MDLDFDLPRRRRSRRGSSWRGRHRHLFAWVVLGGAAVVLGLIVIGLLSALGLGGLIASAYFGIAELILPASWHDEFRAIPTLVHVLAGVAVLGILAGLAGEIFD